MKALSNIGQRRDWFEEADLAALAQQPLDYQASVLDARVMAIERISKRSYTELGLICLYVEEKVLYARIFDSDGHPFKSLSEWLSDRAPFSRSYGYEAMAKLKILRDSGAPMEEIRDVPRCNIQTLSRLSSDLQRDPEVLEAAKTMPEVEFTAKIQREYPEQHIETKSSMIFHPLASVRVKVDEALKQCQEIYDCGRDEALGYLAETFLEVCEREKEAAKVAHV